MDYKKFDKKVFVRLDKGEEIVETLKQLCIDLDIKAGTISGIGATDKATIGLFDIKTKKYHSTDLVGDHEIASLNGNISTIDNKVYLHLHITLGNAEHISLSGHLNSALVSATFEGVIDIIDDEIDREYNSASGLNLIKF